MPMPSLFKYFAFVGAALLGLITLANFLLDPATVATTAATPAKPVIVVQHDPRASKVERWRNEQAALKAAAQAQTADNASLATKSELAPPPAPQAVVTAPAQVPAQAQPVQAPPAQTAAIQPEPALQTADVSAEHDAEAAHAAELARVKAEKVKAAKAAKAARQAKAARERARAEQLAREGGQGQWPQNPWQQGQNSFFGGPQQRTASSQQDQFYYGQRGPREAANAYAPRPSFGPFGGFGR
jgi:type IV secretory pathway VirB10-like protein